MAQASFFTSGRLRRWLGRPAGVSALPSAAGAAAASSLGQGSEWELACADSLIADAVRFAQERRRVAEEIAIELVQQPDLREAPEPVQDFLLQTWTLVMAHGRLAGGGEQCQTLAGLVAPLLWSVRRESTLRRPARLVEIVPGLLQGLREGLALLGRDPRDFQAFFTELERLHQPALELCATRRQLRVADDPPPADWAERLAPGDWLDLYRDHAWVRVRLEWVAPHGGQYMFRGLQGEARTMTRRILLRLALEGLARPATAA